VIVACAILVAIACVAASTRRLWFAANPTALHPDDVVEALGAEPNRAAIERLRKAIADAPECDWERDLFDALLDPREDARRALVNEQLTELDLRMQRWARVPRVCASIATSVAIMLGTLVLRNALADAPDLTGELGTLFVRDVVSDAIAVVAFGVVGTVFCIAANVHTRRMTRARLEASDRMIEKLELAALGELERVGDMECGQPVPPETTASKSDLDPPEDDEAGVENASNRRGEP
jgi:hypothetical protein